METSVLIYDDLPVVSFDVEYVSGLVNHFYDEGEIGTISTFPSFIVEKGEVDRGWMTWYGNSKSPNEIRVQDLEYCIMFAWAGKNSYTSLL